eukprot:1155635-Pelagomonas_calceolata.AAC.16
MACVEILRAFCPARLVFGWPLQILVGLYIFFDGGNDSDSTILFAFASQKGTSTWTPASTSHGQMEMVLMKAGRLEDFLPDTKQVGQCFQTDFLRPIAPVTSASTEWHLKLWVSQDKRL